MTLLSLPQRLKDYQRRLDLSHLRQSSDPMLSEFKVGSSAFLSLPWPTLTLLPRGFSDTIQGASAPPPTTFLTGYQW
jgi:hypothetical protein